MERPGGKPTAVNDIGKSSDEFARATKSMELPSTLVCVPGEGKVIVSVTPTGNICQSRNDVLVLKPSS